MVEALLIKHCSPTLAGLKTAGLFGCCYSELSALMDEVRKVNLILAEKGVRMVPIHWNDHRALLYVYRPKMLEADLKCSMAESILARHGYPVCDAESISEDRKADSESAGENRKTDVESISEIKPCCGDGLHESAVAPAPGTLLSHTARCLARLRERLSAASGEFPHEIGLFLGYPAEDVHGFIAHKGERCKCEGCWKAYTDVESAKRTFAAYRKCTDVYCECYACGRTLGQLTVRHPAVERLRAVAV